MDLYYNQIVSTLIKNIGLNQRNLFSLPTIESKRKFLTEINRLLAEGRIIKAYGDGAEPVRYSPRVLKICEFEKNSGFITAQFPIHYLPYEVLEKELEYINKGTETEDYLSYELEIAGYHLDEKHKNIFENLNDITLDFSKYNYTLWAQYLDPYKVPTEKPAKQVNILYVDNNYTFAINFIKRIKAEHLRNSNWMYFTNTPQAMAFLETKLKIGDPIDLIITENNEQLNGVEFVEALRELKVELENKYIHFYTPVMAFTEHAQDLSFLKSEADGEWLFFHFLKSDDVALIGKVVSSCR